MIVPGDRVGVAVSGGADSVALLRALIELRGELGCVLTVVHFNHKIRPESDGEAEFIETLAQQLGLEFYGSSGDVKKFAAQKRVSLETAARELRYGFFEKLTSGAKAPIQNEALTARLKPRPYEGFSTEELSSEEFSAGEVEPQSSRRLLDKIATAHTLDDQAETVLMKLLRGAGTKGLSGIWPCVRRQAERHSAVSNQHSENQGSRIAEGGCATQIKIIRPMLGVRRCEVESHLRGLGQGWREDASNRDVKHTRNKVRHELLPLLEREYNPNIYQQLADAAEVARGDEEFWAEEIRRREGGGGGQENRTAEDGCATQNLDPAPTLRSARDDKEQYLVLSTQYSEKTNADPSTRKIRSLGMTSVDATVEMNSCTGGGARAYADSNDSETRHAASLRVDLLLNEPLALRRRAVRDAFERTSGKTLDFEHTDSLVRFLERRESSLLQLPESWFAKLDWPRRTLSFEEREPARKDGTVVGGKASKKQGAGSRR
jgi:tRNA(Ile)-lysidine synthase TilS/MesJ